MLAVKNEARTKAEEPKPWANVCTEICWNATEVKCVCRCGARHHGEGIMLGKMEVFMESPTGKPMAEPLPLNILSKDVPTLNEIEGAVITNGGECVSCHKPLRWGSIEAYPHAGGMDILSNSKVSKQWVYFDCSCGYQSALWKVRRKLEK